VPTAAGPTIVTAQAPAAPASAVIRGKRALDGHNISTGVKIIPFQESWTEAPGDLADVLYAIAGWVARMESQRRSERTKAGLDRLKRSGKKLGRPTGARDQKKRRPRRSATVI
jgi:DNA invertase Pin-like site-specific DNA recombinase